MALDQDVYLGERQVCLLAEREEVDLQWRDRVRCAGIHPCRDPPKAAKPLSSVSFFDDPLEFTPVESTTAFRGDDQMFELTIVEASGEVHDRSLYRCNWDASLDRHVLDWQ
jgi:hypothetical protein